jgi:hypothetical protein
MSETGTIAEKQPLDEVMLAMDVVDTLRHHEKLVARELDSDTRDEQLKEKLRKIYRTQGIEVPDHVLEEGVQALREDRFSYQAPKKSFANRLARIYVSRDRWGKWLIGIVAVCLLALVAYQFMVAGPRSAMPDRIRSSYQVVWHSAQSDKARNIVKRINARAETAVQDGNQKEMEKALASFDQLKKLLDLEYSLRIVARPGESSGVWRIPDINSSARNYYIIVEPVSADGEILQVQVMSEETDKQTMVSKWGMRVEEDVFQRVATDKQDDGIIQNNTLGTKKKGYLDPSYVIPTSGGAITSW